MARSERDAVSPGPLSEAVRLPRVAAGTVRSGQPEESVIGESVRSPPAPGVVTGGGADGHETGSASIG